MKQIVLLFATGLLCSFVSCNNEKNEAESTTLTKEESSAAKKNLEASHVVTRAFDTGDPAMIDSVVASDFVDHTETGDKNRDSLKAMIVAWKAASKDAKTEIIKELADDEYVFSWLRFTGTSSGGMGMPAGPYNMTSIEVVRFKDGKAVEHWGFMEPREMMKFMSQQPPADKKEK
jgi:predicted SnoaL-like aldol condensation-catalyzing enzyme